MPGCAPCSGGAKNAAPVGASSLNGPGHDPAPANLHGSTLIVGEAGVLIRGAPGAGKTRLALALVAAARRDGTFASLVADDRTLVTRYGDRLVARPHPALAGRVERRGIGIMPIDHEPACVLALVVDLVEGWPDRLPERDARRCEVARVVLPRLALATGASTPDAVMLILSVVAASCDPA